MALIWDWNEPVGLAKFKIKTEEGEGEKIVRLYQGNAYLIMIEEYEENGKDLYTLAGFFADKEHAKNCLGLAKGYKKNIYNNQNNKLISICFNKRYTHTAELGAMLLKAFDEIDISKA